MSVGWKVVVSELAIMAMLSCVCSARASTVDVTPRPVIPIPPGTQIDKAPPKGWSHLIFVSYPRITKEDASKLPGFAKDLATFLTGSMIANVVRENADGKDTYRLQKLAFGFGMAINGRHTIISSATQKKLGAGLGIMSRTILSSNEEFQRDKMRLVAKTATMAVVDMSQYVLHKGRHRLMVVRYCILLVDGKLGTLVWLLDPQSDNTYQLADAQMQFLPSRMQEDRVINVDEDKIVLGTIPKEDAFALAKIPQGKSVPFREGLKRVAALRRFSVETAKSLETELRKLWGR